MNATSASTAAPGPRAKPRVKARPRRRAWWLKQLHRWHWISAAVSLTGMLMFAATGITLNHAGDIATSPRVTRLSAQVPEADMALLRGLAAAGTPAAPLPQPVARWVRRELQLRVVGVPAEWSADEVYLSLPRPGGDGWLSIDLVTGAVQAELTDQGWVSYLNDLHKGRHTGFAWSVFLDVFAVACLLFSLTGLWLLKLHSSGRAMTWPLVGLGLALPALIALFLIH